MGASRRRSVAVAPYNPQQCGKEELQLLQPGGWQPLRPVSSTPFPFILNHYEGSQNTNWSCLAIRLMGTPVSCCSLAKEIHIPEYPLHEQYRMHSKIREFIGQAFYADIHPALHESSDLDSMRPRPQPQG